MAKVSNVHPGSCIVLIKNKIRVVALVVETSNEGITIGTNAYKTLKCDNSTCQVEIKITTCPSGHSSPPSPHGPPPGPG